MDVQRLGLVRTHIPQCSNPQQEGYHDGTGGPWGARGPGAMSGSPAQGTYTRKMSPHNVWLCKPAEANLQESQRAAVSQDSTQEGHMHQCIRSEFQQRQLEKQLGHTRRLMTNFRGCGGAGIWWNFLQGQKCCHLSFTLLPPGWPGTGRHHFYHCPWT